MLWAGRPVLFSARELFELLRLGLARSGVALVWLLILGWLSGVTFGRAAIPLGVVIATLACGYTLARELGRRTDSSGCALTILVVLAPALLATWTLVAWRNPKQVFELLVNPGFVVGCLGVLVSAAHVVGRLLDAGSVHYFVTTQRACEVRRLAGEWAVAWVERLSPERCSLRASRGPSAPPEWGDVAFGGGKRHVFRRLERPKRLVESLRRGLADAWEAADEARRAGARPAAAQEAEPPPPPPLTPSRRRLPPRWRAALDLGPGEELLWVGRPGRRLRYELRGLLRGGVTIAGTLLGLLVLLLTPGLSQSSARESLLGLGILVALVLLVVSLSLLGVALLRLFEDLSRALTIAALASLLILVPSLAEALWTARLPSLLADPLAWASFALSALGALHVARAAQARRRVRYVLSSRRAFALDGESGALRWSAVLGAEPRDVRAIPLGLAEEGGAELGHLRFGHGLAARSFWLVEDPRALSELAEAARYWRTRPASSPSADPPAPAAGRAPPQPQPQPPSRPAWRPQPQRRLAGPRPLAWPPEPGRRPLWRSEPGRRQLWRPDSGRARAKP